LHLLERHAEQVSQLGLRHAFGHAPRTDTLTDFDVIRRRALGPRLRDHVRARPSAGGNVRQWQFGVSVVVPAIDYREVRVAHCWLRGLVRGIGTGGGCQRNPRRSAGRDRDPLSAGIVSVSSCADKSLKQVHERQAAMLRG
jgi:hypothetical protein